MKMKCHMWYCFKKGKFGLQVNIGGHSKIVGWYCEKHAKMADVEFRAGNIKTKVPIAKYEDLPKDFFNVGEEPKSK